MREVCQTLKGMPRGKSPDLDDLNVEFYIFYWNVVGHQLFEAIKKFFDKAYLPASCSKKYIFLIPKIVSPKAIPNYRPILLCNVSYKIISKII